METLCIVTAQYYNEDGKAKGGQTFSMRVDSDLFMYAPKELIADALQELIQENYPYEGRVEYRSHELIFVEPIEIKDANLEARMDRLFATTNVNQNSK